jgi:hypothetical protein
VTAEGALALTLAIEVPLATLAARLCLPAAPWRRVLLAALCASLLTHPFAWWANRTLPWPFVERATLIELSVVAAETLVYALLVPLRLRAGFGLALWANGASFGLGLLWWYLGLSG